jgi:peptide/nickel transport system permease protein
MATTGQEEFTLDTASELASEEKGTQIEGRSPWALAWRRLRRNHVALFSLGVFLLIVVACTLAGVYSNHISHLGENDANVSGTIVANGKRIRIISQAHTTIVNGQAIVTPGDVPIGPQLGAAGGKYVLGADELGRDIATRLLYGGANSLFVGGVSAVICTVLSVILALLAGYFGGASDWLISRLFDLIWAFPVVLLGIALGTALQISGFQFLFIDISGTSLWIPTLIIAFVFIPYLGRPLRGQILALRQREFVEAATAQGASPLRIMFSELLPNIASSVLVLFTLIVASTILTEATLSFLGAGVQPPLPSWGTMMGEGQSVLATNPWLSLFPGMMLAITVLSINVFGDGLRDALDPRAKVRIEH